LPERFCRLPARAAATSPYASPNASFTSLLDGSGGHENNQTRAGR
jgi:hypothetical protein